VGDLTKEAVDALRPVEVEKRANVDEPPILEHARDDRVGVRLRIEGVEVDVPEYPTHALGETTAHARRIAHVERDSPAFPP
jgi:hypothetical protein